MIRNWHWNHILEDVAYGLRAVYVFPKDMQGMGGDEGADTIAATNTWKYSLNPYHLSNVLSYWPDVEVPAGQEGSAPVSQEHYVDPVEAPVGSIDVVKTKQVGVGSVPLAEDTPYSFKTESFTIDTLDKTIEQNNLYKIINKGQGWPLKSNIFSQKVHHHQEFLEISSTSTNDDYADWAYQQWEDVYSIPLAAVELSPAEMPEQMKNGSFADLRAGYPVFLFDSAIPLGKHVFDRLYKKLRKDSRFKLFFEHIFPLKRMLGLNVVYGVENFVQFFTDPCAFDSVFKKSKEYIGSLINMVDKSPSGGSNLGEPYMSNPRNTLKGTMKGGVTCTPNVVALGNFISGGSTTQQTTVVVAPQTAPPEEEEE